MSKIDWDGLPHSDQVELLKTKSLEDLVAIYASGDLDPDALQSKFQEEQTFWHATEIRELKTAGKPPNKDVVLGAWRDLEWSEALLELIDNSIDAYRSSKPSTAKTPGLEIWIEVDEGDGTLTYSDNAGGVSEKNLANLVVPGSSDTTALSPTIGSYKTGGKKAIFRMSTAAEILTWKKGENPATDYPVSVHLDEKWMSDPEIYEFTYAVMNNKNVIERGHTRYNFRLRQEGSGEIAWYLVDAKIEKIVREIQRAYTLLLTRNPDIAIYFLEEPIKPDEKLYEFSGANNKDVDVRPQQLIFHTKMEYDGKMHDLSFEVVIGTRTTVAVNSDNMSGGGIDLYGNDRMFQYMDQVLLARHFPTGNTRNLVRGYVNILGPNIFVPWDTHKRHLNVDRRIVDILINNPTLVELFKYWSVAYQQIGKGLAVVKEKQPAFSKPSKDINIATEKRAVITLNARTNKAISSTEISYPRVPVTTRSNDQISISFKLAPDEARQIATHLGINATLSPKALNQPIKIFILQQTASGKRSKKP